MFYTCANSIHQAGIEKVLCNNLEIPHTKECNTKEGWVVHYKKDDNERIILTPCGTTFQEFTAKGEVEVVIRDKYKQYF